MRLNRLQELDDTQLGARLGAAFDALPAADPVRLARIRERLPQPAAPRSNGLPRGWLLVGLLAGAVAAAAATWWGIRHQPTNPAVNTQVVPPVERLAPTEPAPPAPPAEPVDPGQMQGDDNPIIFKQEQY